MVMRQSEQQAQARDRAEHARARAEWEAVMAASRAAQRDGSVDFSGTTEPFPDHDQVIVGAGACQVSACHKALCPVSTTHPGILWDEGHTMMDSGVGILSQYFMSVNLLAGVLETISHMRIS